MSTKYYVKHKNPKHPATDGGKKWAKDGPFSDEKQREKHIRNCEYEPRGIPYERTEEKDRNSRRNTRTAELEETTEEEPEESSGETTPDLDDGGSG